MWRIIQGDDPELLQHLLPQSEISWTESKLGSVWNQWASVLLLWALREETITVSSIIHITSAAVYLPCPGSPVGPLHGCWGASETTTPASISEDKERRERRAASKQENKAVCTEGPECQMKWMNIYQ